MKSSYQIRKHLRPRGNIYKELLIAEAKSCLWSFNVSVANVTTFLYVCLTASIAKVADIVHSEMKLNAESLANDSSLSS